MTDQAAGYAGFVGYRTDDIADLAEDFAFEVGDLLSRLEAGIGDSDQITGVL